MLLTKQNNLKDTIEAEILEAMEEYYSKIAQAQSEWYSKSRFTCPEGCGECCRNFEPDILECEALYMAAWLIQNQPEVAQSVAEGIFPFPRENACPFWNETNPYHCSIYGGRPSVCRLFGATCSKDKKDNIVFHPCKFYPASKLANYNNKLMHRQYTKEEALSIFGVLPPVMSDLMEPIISINPDNQETKFIRDILPQTVQKLLWIFKLNGN